MFYRKELEIIDLGAKIKPLIPRPAKRRLIRLGVLEYRKSLDRTSGIALSPRGGKMLDSYKAEI